MSPTRTRRLVAVLAGALALGGLVGLAPSASAEQTGAPVAGSGTATWGISDLLGTARMGFPSPSAAPYVDPAAYDAATKTVSWGSGSGTVGADGSASLSFSGATVQWATTGNAWLRIADPQVSVDDDGDGAVTAEVSYGTTTGGQWNTAATVRGPQRLPVIDLASTVDLEEHPTYPAALADLEVDFAADADSYDWSGLKGVWDPSLLDFLAGDEEAEVAPFVYASTVVNGVGTSGGTSGISRFPAELTLAIDRAVASTTVEASPVGDGITITVAGSGFRRTAPGLYVSLRQRTPGDAAYAGGSLPMDAPTSWVSNDPADISEGEQGAAAAIDEDGEFTTSLVLDATAVAELDPSGTYTVVTRTAHGQGGLPGNASQVTETPLDLGSLREPTSTTATAAKATPGEPAAVRIAVGAAGGTPTGTVVLSNGAEQVGTAVLDDGTATVPVSGLPLGTTTLTVAYQGDTGYWHSTGTVAVRVAQRTTSTGVTFVRKATAKVPGKVGIVVRDKYSSRIPSGKVDVLLLKGNKVVKGIRGATLSASGKVILVLPPTGKTTWKIKVNYLGSAVHLPSSKSMLFKVVR